MDVSYDYTDFGPQIPFLGSEGLFSPFWPSRVNFFLLHAKFPNDGCITRPYWFWASISVFGLWRLWSLIFLTLKSKFFLAPCKIPDMPQDHTTLKAYFHIFDPQNNIFLASCKTPNRWTYHTTILILDPKFRFLALKAYTFLTLKSNFFLVPCKIPERWMYYTTILILGPKFHSWALKKKNFVRAYSQNFNSELPDGIFFKLFFRTLNKPIKIYFIWFKVLFLFLRTEGFFF
jgi:hypothetical protein